MNYFLTALLVIALFGTAELTAQNIVPNHSFEGVENLPIKPNPKNSYEYEPLSGYIPFLKNLQYWYKGTQTTPDLRITSSTNFYECQKRYQDCDRARTGNHMVGIITSLSNTYTDSYREYIQVKLGKTLRPGVRVHAELWAVKERSAKLVSNNIGFYFSQKEVYEDTEEVLDKIPQINWDSVINRDTQQWVKISGSFVPDEPLRYLTIGNFFGNDSTQILMYPHYTASPYTPPYSYYLIDDVRIWQEGDTVKPLVFEGTVVKENEPVELQNIYFSFDKAVLEEASFVELKKLITFLQTNPDIKIAIQGHTDDRGNDAYNLKLSKARAQAVVDYIIGQKIPAERLKPEGFGEQKPLESNASKPGRAANRRVEFVVIK